MLACAYVYTVRVCACTYIFVCTYECVCICVCLPVHVCVDVCACTYVCILEYYGCIFMFAIYRIIITQNLVHKI